MKCEWNNHSSRKSQTSERPANLHQTLQQTHTHISEEKRERKQRKNATGAQYGWLSRSPAAPLNSEGWAGCATCVQDANTVDPSSLSRFPFSSGHRSDFPVLSSVRTASLHFLQHNPSMGTIPELFTTQVCLRDQRSPPLCYNANKTAVCLCYKATGQNSLMLTKCLKIREQKSVEFTQQKKRWTPSLKNEPPAHKVTTPNSLVSETYIQTAKRIGFCPWFPRQS